MASSPAIVSVVDFLNVWGLIAIGLGLILGLLTRIATISGIVIISMYCLSHPSLIDVEYMLPSNENVLWFGKNIIFLFLLLIMLFFPTGKQIGMDRLLFKNKENQ
jgi:thiosulfate dehydrogenase [quinone] large subunit